METDGSAGNTTAERGCVHGKLNIRGSFSTYCTQAVFVACLCVCMRQAGRDLKTCFVNSIPVLLPFSIHQSWGFQELESQKWCKQVSQCLGWGDASMVELLYMLTSSILISLQIPAENHPQRGRTQLGKVPAQIFGKEQCELLLDMVCSNCVSLLRVTASPRGEGICLPRSGGESLFVFAVR